ncbi:MAG: pyruvate, phosphate dikinase [Gemmatimonadetes bacterium]|nr:MAG: pyruvate, phosphate dikinase [Gemmatimonadota bacterium]
MITKNEPMDKIIQDLQERAKELNCLYKVEELTVHTEYSIPEVLNEIVHHLPPGWQYPDICQAQICYQDQVFQSAEFEPTPWVQEAPIIVHDEEVGKISIYYLEEMPTIDEGPFLQEERKLINTIADRISHFILHHQLKEVFQREKSGAASKNWRVALELLRQTDPQLLRRISRKMANYLCWNGCKAAEALLEYFTPKIETDSDLLSVNEANRPQRRSEIKNIDSISDQIFELASDYLGEGETLVSIQKWIKEEKSNFLVNILENAGTSLGEVADAIGRYHHFDPEGHQLSSPREKAFRVSLIQRFLMDQQDFVNIAKEYITLADFYDLMHHVIHPTDSRGKLGGKAAGLVLANRILKRSKEQQDLLKDIKIPKTWYITSDAILSFLHYNNLEDVVEQKYKDIGQVRQEYPSIIQVFKNSHFPEEIIKGLSYALDDFGTQPLVVRSSSLLEDRMGTAFAGKYKSLFIANQGTKAERMAALIDAIQEVYASTFGPDPIEYRAERGLLDFHEEMGILIQAVAGTRIGDYFLPAYAGVAFSNNEFRWSPRIKRSDGLVRLVPGLGTRAVDRTNDYPILIAPGQPGLRANVTVDEKIWYSPKEIDVINLKTNQFETIPIEDLLRKHGFDYPRINQVVSIVKQNHIQTPMGMHLDFEHDEMVVTFDGLIKNTNFVKKIHAILTVLQQTLGTPVDIEFACDGTDFYLLQCRPQSYAADSKPAEIPTDINPEELIFSANRYITNGTVTGITHIVYVDPQKYAELDSREALFKVGRAVGKLNQLLPKRQFILMGPGRWGSRGDIKLGVNVTYSDINNTAMLIEIARKKGNYVPDLSFGTHFFQDLVEAGIRYLPLYPDDEGIVFNESFLTESPNVFSEILPQHEAFAEVIRVIDVPEVTHGQILTVLMNGDDEEAVGLLTTAKPPEFHEQIAVKETYPPQKSNDDHWRWRLRMAEKIAAQLDPQRFGVKAFYLFGSTKNATAGPGSDIDLLLHVSGTPEQRQNLLNWLEGWSICLAELNYLRTGETSNGLLDVHLVTDEDIENRTSYAVKINAVTDAARELRMGTTTQA